MPKKKDARRPSALPLMQLASSFWAFKTLAVAEELQLFDHVARSRGMTTESLAVALGIDVRPAEMMLTACAALGLLQKRGGRYRNTPLADTYLVHGKPYGFGGFIAMLNKRLYPAWAGSARRCAAIARRRGTRTRSPASSRDRIRS